MLKPYHIDACHIHPEKNTDLDVDANAKEHSIQSL